MPNKILWHRSPIKFPKSFHIYYNKQTENKSNKNKIKQEVLRLKKISYIYRSKVKFTWFMNTNILRSYSNESWILNWNMLITALKKTRRNFSLVSRYSLKFSPCSLLFVKSLVTRCKIHSLLIVEVARCKKSLVTRCRSCSLQKTTRYSLQNLLVVCCRSCSLQKITRYSLQKITRYPL